MHNPESYLNYLLYPILFEENPPMRAVQVSDWIKTGKMGYKPEQLKYFLEAIGYFLKDTSILSKTIAPDYDVESFKKYLLEIKKCLEL